METPPWYNVYNYIDERDFFYHPDYRIYYPRPYFYRPYPYYPRPYYPYYPWY